MVLKKRRFLIGGLIVLVAVGFLGFQAFAGAATYYYSVDEVLAQGSSVYGENVRVEGTVLAGSIEREMAGRLWKFTIVDDEGRQSLPVVFQGAAPDTFVDGASAVVEGSLSSDGIFRATTLMARCPSKYEPEAPAETG